MATQECLNLVSKLPDSKSVIKRVPVDGFHHSLESCLRSEILSLTQEPNLDRLRFLSRGRILDPVKPLSESGVKCDSTIYILRQEPQKDSEDEPMQDQEQPTTPTEEERNQFSLAFGIAISSPALKSVVKRLTDQDNLESLAATCPGLAKDPVAIALLSRPETLVSLLNPEVFNSVSKNHPALIQACENLMAVVHEEDQSTAKAGARGGGNGGGRDLQGSAISSFAYHLDDMSDVDEDDEEDEEGRHRGAGGVARNASFSAITPDQLAAAIMAAQNPTGMGFPAPPTPQPRLGGNGGAGPTSALNLPTTSSGAASSDPSPTTLGSPNITSDMFRQAMAQALRGAGGGAAVPAAPAPSPSQVMEQKVAQMREMGIADESAARNALTVMDGDVQAAVDLILSGWNGQMEEE